MEVSRLPFLLKVAQWGEWPRTTLRLAGPTHLTTVPYCSGCRKLPKSYTVFIRGKSVALEPYNLLHKWPQFRQYFLVFNIQRKKWNENVWYKKEKTEVLQSFAALTYLFIYLFFPTIWMHSNSGQSHRRHAVVITALSIKKKTLQGGKKTLKWLLKRNAQFGFPWNGLESGSVTQCLFFCDFDTFLKPFFVIYSLKLKQKNSTNIGRLF